MFIGETQKSVDLKWMKRPFLTVDVGVRHIGKCWSGGLRPRCAFGFCSLGLQLPPLLVVLGRSSTDAPSQVSPEIRAPHFTPMEFVQTHSKQNNNICGRTGLTGQKFSSNTWSNMSLFEFQIFIHTVENCFPWHAGHSSGNNVLKASAIKFLNEVEAISFHSD